MLSRASQSCDLLFQVCGSITFSSCLYLNNSTRACQIADFKPKHKAICGKALDIETATGIAVSKVSLPILPPATKRSSFLLRHIQHLNDNPSQDVYVCLQGNGDPSDSTFMLFNFNFPPVKDIFRAAREQAMSTGDREIVLAMCHYTLWFFMATEIADHFKINFRSMYDQMEREWETSDFKQGMMEMQDRQFRDVLRRP